MTGGVDVVRIHEPGLDHDVELAALRTAWDVAARHRHLVMVSDSARLAADFGADAVHLSDAGGTAELADFRSRLGRFTRLGSTASDGSQLRRLLGEPTIDFPHGGRSGRTRTGRRGRRPGTSRIDGIQTLVRRRRVRRCPVGGGDHRRGPADRGQGHPDQGRGSAPDGAAALPTTARGLGLRSRTDPADLCSPGRPVLTVNLSLRCC
ncbi:thiamine phosphate synthase [Microlunatus sp. Gsoil 973]|uniref:thiamine phosphate synthase n=1 Tax=Microlunatus sp. Gsoil 973 TaxID=2672569 RepID=UPI00351ADE7F